MTQKSTRLPVVRSVNSVLSIKIVRRILSTSTIGTLGTIFGLPTQRMLHALISDSKVEDYLITYDLILKSGKSLGLFFILIYRATVYVQNIIDFVLQLAIVTYL
jgi:hypothetical protein